MVGTCHSSLSRNYRVGYALGRGKSLDDAVAELGEVAEGVNTLMLVKQYADKIEVSMPLVNALYALIFEDADASSMAASLMDRDQKLRCRICPTAQPYCKEALNDHTVLMLKMYQWEMFYACFKM